MMALIAYALIGSELFLASAVAWRAHLLERAREQHLDNGRFGRVCSRCSGSDWATMAVRCPGCAGIGVLWDVLPVDDQAEWRGYER